MTTAQALAAFTLAAAILTITPGLDTAMVLRTAASEGAGSARRAALGIAPGCLTWGGLVAIGLGALLAASPALFLLLKWVGAAYLAWLGLGLILRPHGMALLDAGTPRAPDAAFRRGFLTNLLNPKVGVFYLTFLPQFVPDGANAAGFSFLLAAVHVLLSLIWFSVLIFATARISRLLSDPDIARTLDRIAGGVFMGFALRLALTSRG
ncbi:MAG: LysE family transporter [Alphaproteobacteria bacterium]|nr:LysE family transporter [Alphaproteobacteria bacterium]